VEIKYSTSAPSDAAPAVTFHGAAATQRLIGVTGEVSGMTGTAFRDIDVAPPGLPVWSPPPA
jgi:hypothetical protein